MYIPRKLRMANVKSMHQFIQHHSFGSIVSSDSNQQLSATHIPFLLVKDEGEFGTLYGHFAKANSHWQTLLSEPSHDHPQSLIIFTGPHSYISPTWYETRPAVPTWNYTAVHTFGKAQALNKEESINMLMDMSYFFEPSLKEKTDVLNDDITLKLLPAIVGFKIPIERIEGVEKLGQHKPSQDQKGVYENLQQSHQHEDIALAEYMNKKNLGKGATEK